MNNLLLSISFLCFLNVGISQITISSTDFNEDQADFIISQSSETNLDYSLSGANATWNFSTLIANSQYTRTHNSMSTAPLFVQALYGLFAPTTYKADYYQSATSLPFDLLPAGLPITIEDVNQFTRVTNDSLTLVGFSLVANGQEIPFRSDTVEKAYDFPLEYGDTYSSRAYTSADLNPIVDAKLIQYKQRNSAVDGWGTLTTPFGTFDALRIKHEISEIDSVYFDVGGFGNWIQLPVPSSTIYEWWTNNEDIPLLSITTQDILGQEQISSVEYKDNAQPGLGISTVADYNSTIKVNNPAINTLHIFTEEQLITATLFDITGKKLHQSVSKTIEVSNLPKGFYKLVIVTENQTKAIKVVIQN